MARHSSPLDDSFNEEPDRISRLLVKQLRRGESGALDECMELLWAPLLGYATRLLNSRDGAEDVVQTAFIRLWNSRLGLKEDGSVGAYLYRTVRNLSIDEQRKSRLRRLWQSHNGAGRHSKTPTPLEEVQAGQLAGAIEKALRGLPARRREVLELARFHRLTYREIAEVLDISPQTVANQMSAALTQLRIDLAAHLDGPTESG